MADKNRVFIGEIWEVESGKSKLVRLEGMPPLVLFRIAEEFFLLDDTCTHGNASLSEGDVCGSEVECPFHAGRFDIRTGQATRFPCTDPLRTYPVVVEGEAIFADLDEEGES
ncbi:non-heme iron oxygenase ferredoxin subunit [Ramlibacter albus]|uniref:Non-heme iron oxygenase ferredoxin subunit n=1 Tax=Ramlibacter albus TaxID=2079448 RepID=A0A923M557_9BURK|nr:non-heme iron oxygenase ferredoxin subunit [Ramlibacter albus]MBC5763014.1 non-heme iron oxygenase ferredoxin subunit [Ramlibacter albus]